MNQCARCNTAGATKAVLVELTWFKCPGCNDSHEQLFGTYPLIKLCDACMGALSDRLRETFKEFMEAACGCCGFGHDGLVQAERGFFSQCVVCKGTKQQFD